MSAIKASQEFVQGVHANWYANQGYIITLTVIELEKYSKLLGILDDDADEEHNQKDSNLIAEKFVDLIMMSNTPDEYIAAIEKEFLNPRFN